MISTERCLIALCKIFARHKQRSLSTISRLATGSGETIARLERGGAITTRRADRAVRYLAERWPADLDWPADIPRPQPRLKKTAEKTA